MPAHSIRDGKAGRWTFALANDAGQNIVLVLRPLQAHMSSPREI
jgi:hypothetical protein